MKKVFSIAMISIMSVFILTGCNGNKKNDANVHDSITTTVEPTIIEESVASTNEVLQIEIHKLKYEENNISFEKSYTFDKVDDIKVIMDALQNATEVIDNNPMNSSNYVINVIQKDTSKNNTYNVWLSDEMIITIGEGQYYSVDSDNKTAVNDLLENSK